METHDERRKMFVLTREDLVLISEEGAQRALSKITTAFFTSIGKMIVTRIVFITAAILTAFYIYLKSQNVVP